MPASQPAIPSGSLPISSDTGNHPAGSSANPSSVNETVSAKTWMAVSGATLGAFMAVLNIQIVNASLANIQGAIGAGIDEGG